MLIAPGTASKFKRQGAYKDDPLRAPYSSALPNVARAGGGNTGSEQDDFMLLSLEVAARSLRVTHRLLFQGVVSLPKSL